MDKEIEKYYIEKAKDIQVQMLNPKTNFKTKEEVDKWYYTMKCIEKNFEELFKED